MKPTRSKQLPHADVTTRAIQLMAKCQCRASAGDADAAAMVYQKCTIDDIKAPMQGTVKVNIVNEVNNLGVEMLVTGAKPVQKPINSFSTSCSHTSSQKPCLPSWQEAKERQRLNVNICWQLKSAGKAQLNLHKQVPEATSNRCKLANQILQQLEDGWPSSLKR